MKVLLYNARIWRSGAECYTWVLFDQVTGKTMQCGHGSGKPKDVTASHMQDMEQQWIFPGFHDSHMHATWLGQKLCGEDLKLPPSIDEMKKRVVEIAEGVGQNVTWISGIGWDHEIMERMPDKADLDDVVSDRPVVMWRICQHLAVVNSKALELANITADTEDPENGRIDRYPDGHPKAGEPTGILREDGGMDLILNVMSAQTTQQVETNIIRALQQCLEFGLTSIHPVDQRSWNEYVGLAKRNMLPIHCYFAAWHTDMGSSNFPTTSGESYNNLSCDCVKVFMDGALNGETAALSQPYLNSTDNNCGVLLHTEEEVEKCFTEITRAGFRLEIHVIGDRAAEIALKYLKKCKVPPESRPIFVHCQILREELLDEMLQCGVVPTIQPSFVPTDSKGVRNRLPQSLMDCIYPWKTLLKKGIVCGGSSDTPVETANPLRGIYDAIFRPDMLHGGDKPFIADECLTFQEAVDLYTTGSAYADKAESRKGKIEPGFQADYVLLDVPKDAEGVPLNLPEQPELLLTTRVKSVWIKGKLAMTNFRCIV